ncbi:Tn3 family transposase, partial [Escherichia coli]
MGSCAAPSAKGDDKFITTDYLQQCRFEQQRYRASGLNLVTAAIVLWNTVYLERATQGLVEA